MTDKPKYIPTTILRANPGMIRDCWWEVEEGVDILVLRQIRIRPEAVMAEMKCIRLVGGEIDMLQGVLSRRGIDAGKKQASEDSNVKTYTNS